MANQYKKIVKNIVFNGIAISAFAALLLTYKLKLGKQSLRLQAKSITHNLALIKQAINIIDVYYVDKKKVNPLGMCDRGVEEIKKNVAQLKIDTQSAHTYTITGPKNEKYTFDCNLAEDPDSFAHLLNSLDNFIFKKKWLGGTEIHQKYFFLDQFIKGALATLDPHSSFLDANEYSELKGQTKGKFGGLGILVNEKNNLLTVISPIKGTPAERSGVKKGDQIVRINEDETFGVDMSALVDQMRGDPGSVIRIDVKRKSEQNLKRINITREEIKIENVKSKYLEGGVVWLKILNFGGPIADELREHIDKIGKEHKSIVGYIVDLRDNPGGLLDEAIKVSDIFIDSGIIVSTKSAKSSESFARSSKTLLDMPVAVLVNNGSASASEIVAGALQDHERAVVIGTKTFGKGSVQSLFDLEEGHALKLTVSKYFTPSGRSIQNLGITPDIYLNPIYINDKTKTVRFAYSESERREKDLLFHLDNTDGSLSHEKIRIDYKYSASMEEQGDELDGVSMAVDYEIKFAKSVIAAYLVKTEKDFNAFRMLEKVKPHLRSIQKQARAELSAYFAQNKIDWAGGKKQIVYKNEIASKVTVTRSKPKNTFAAGETMNIGFHLKNKTSHDLFQVRALVLSKSPLFNGRELIYGKILPGGTSEKTLPITIPEYWETGEHSFEIIVFSQNEEVYKSGPTHVKVNAIKAPEFSFSYVLDDHPRLKVVGNGNDIVNLGETVSVVFKVKNTGQGTANKLKVSIVSLAGDSVVVKEGAPVKRELKPAEEVTASFFVSVNPGFRGSHLSLGLKIEDEGFLKTNIKSIVIPVSRDNIRQSLLK